MEHRRYFCFDCHSRRVSIVDPKVRFPLPVLSVVDRILTVVASSELGSPGTVLPDNFYSLDLLVVPMWGLYANMIAQFISQISSHFILNYHRRVVTDWNKGMEVDKAPQVNERSKESDINFDGPVSDAVRPRTVRLARHGFTRPHRGDSTKLVARRSVISALLVLTWIICMLVALGCTLPSFSLRVLGVVGIMVEIGQNFHDATTEYSLFGVLVMLFKQASITGRAADYVGLGSLSVLLLLSVLIVPIVQSVCLLVLWLRPMTSRRREQLSLGVEILAAWQYAEVYVLAVVIACWYVCSNGLLLVVASRLGWLYSSYVHLRQATRTSLRLYGQRVLPELVVNVCSIGILRTPRCRRCAMFSSRSFDCTGVVPARGSLLGFGVAQQHRHELHVSVHARTGTHGRNQVERFTPSDIRRRRQVRDGRSIIGSHSTIPATSSGPFYRHVPLVARSTGFGRTSAVPGHLDQSSDIPTIGRIVRALGGS